MSAGQWNDQTVIRQTEQNGEMSLSTTDNTRHPVLKHNLQRWVAIDERCHVLSWVKFVRKIPNQQCLWHIAVVDRVQRNLPVGHSLVCTFQLNSAQRNTSIEQHIEEAPPCYVVLCNERRAIFWQRECHHRHSSLSVYEKDAPCNSEKSWTNTTWTMFIYFIWDRCENMTVVNVVRVFVICTFSF